MNAAEVGGSIPSARVKVEVTLNFLATGNTYRTLQHLFRIGSCRLQLLFTYIDVGCNVIVSDGRVFQNCSLYTALENGQNYRELTAVYRITTCLGLRFGISLLNN